MTKYDTTIRTVTKTERQTTVHTDYIDWDYNFGDPKHTSCMCTDDAGKKEAIARQIGYLNTCERFNEVEVYASDYGGWPRIWQKVLAVGMVSQWPYWEPRPCVLITSTLGPGWVDWWSLTGAEVRAVPAAEKEGE